MFSPPKTKEEAKAHRYTVWGGNPDGYRYREVRCAYEVTRHHIGYQCERRNGYGPEDLCCAQHAKKVKTGAGA